MTAINTLKNLIADESGATAIEYGLLSALIAVAAITAMSELGSSLSDLFKSVAEHLKVVPQGS